MRGSSTPLPQIFSSSAISEKALEDKSLAPSQIKSTKYMGAYGVANLGFGSESEVQDQRSEVIVTAELERHLFKAKEILAENREYLDKLAKALYEKETLLNSEIAAIRATCTIKPAVVG